ncbi:MAG: Gfo/Idh/MocA family protein [Candidatus Bathyarchaeia archaeon]
MRHINLGVAGAGGMGLSFALRCTQLDEAYVISIADVPDVCSTYEALTEGRTEEFLRHRPNLRKRLSDPKVKAALKALTGELDPDKMYTDHHDLAEDSDVDAVYVATPNVYHAPVTVAMLEGDKHVLCEKPMATTLEEARKMVEASERSGKILQIGFQNRFSEDAQFVSGLVKMGALGRIYKSKSYAIHVNWGPDGWFTQKDLAGGGALMDMGVHAIDMTRFLLGEPKCERVYSKIETRFRDYDVDDVSIIMIEFDDGCTSIVESGWWNTYSDGSEAATQLFGEKGYARIYPTELNMELGGKWGTYKPVLEHSDPYDNEIKHFIDCILTGEPTRAPGEVGLEAQKIIEAAYESSKLGRAVRI